MKIVMPIAGLGSRFTKVGINTPKPLIEIMGKKMIQWSRESIPFAKNEDFIFIVRKEHVNEFHIDEELKKIFGPKIKIIIIDYVTQGMACTVLLAKEFINNDEQLIITDADHYFINKKYYDQLQHPEKYPEVKGGIPTFEATDPKWSFSKVDDNGYIVEIAEKIPISPYANVGEYYFRHGKDYVAAAEEMIKKDLRVRNEFYVAPVYNLLIEKGYKFTAPVCDEMWGLGTPEDVAFFKENHKE